MKRVLITGAGSYIGMAFKEYIEKNYSDQYKIDAVGMINGSWREKSFSGYDSVFHVAGVAHQKETSENAHLYFEVNRDLAVEVARKAKAAGVRQFVFLSSMSVYGMNAGVIAKKTLPDPKTNYGRSKLQAEEKLTLTGCDTFKVCILRPPMVYGAGCRGNYPRLSKIAQKTPIFPYVENERSMLYIENLCEFVHLMIQNEESGIFCPQNEEYSNTGEFVKMIAEAHGKHVILVKGFEWLLKLMSCTVPEVNKVFGSLRYDKQLSTYKDNYCKYDVKSSISLAEGK